MSREQDLTWAVDAGVLVVASLLTTQEYGHTVTRAQKRTCLCRWCEAHRYVIDHESDVQPESRKTYRQLVAAIARNEAKIKARPKRAWKVS